jgi:hypothetical protein
MEILTGIVHKPTTPAWNTVYIRTVTDIVTERILGKGKLSVLLIN